MKFTFLTLFPCLLEPYFQASILKRAVESSLIEVNFIDIRTYSENKYKKVDDYMIGGSAGLLLSIEPLAKALRALQAEDKNIHVIFPNPCGKKFTQNDAVRLSNYEHIVFICGRYEGIDERFVEIFVNEVLSLGDFILTGGELSSLCMMDSISRNIKGVLGNSSSLLGESFENNLLESPNFTKPNNFENNFVISEFLKGNHSKINILKNSMAYAKTRFFRPDLYQKLKVAKVKKDKSYEK